MTSILGITLAITTVLVAIAFVLAYQFTKSQKQRWLQKFEPDHQPYTQCNIGYIDRDKITKKRLKEIQRTNLGVLFYGDDWARCVIGDRHTRDNVKVIDFNCHSELALLTLQSWMVNLPPLIRWTQGDRSYYFVATNALGMADDRKTQTLFAQLAPHFNGFTIYYGNPKPWVKRLTIFTLILTLCLAGNAIVTGWRLPFQVGVGFVDIAPSGDIFAASPTYLYRLDASGNLQDRYALKDFGITEGLADLHAIDRDQFLLADWQTGTLQRCQINQKSCQVLPNFQNNPSSDATFNRTLKLTVDRQRELIYATDTARHRLVALTLEGEEIESTRGGEMKLCFPNGITLSREGKVVIADTNNFRVVTWSVNNRGLELTPDRQIDFVRSPRPETVCIPSEQPREQNPIVRDINSLSSVAREYRIEGEPLALEVAQSGRVFPTFVEQDRLGFWWVLVGDRDLARDNILRFDSNWENPQRVALPGEANISRLAVGGDRVLITLPEQYDLRSISIDDFSVRSFGNQAFREALKAEQRSETYLRRSHQSSIAIALVGVLFLLGIVVWEQRQKFVDLVRLDPTL
jgi:hypothetical protein